MFDQCSSSATVPTCTTGRVLKELCSDPLSRTEGCRATDLLRECLSGQNQALLKTTPDLFLS